MSLPGNTKQKWLDKGYEHFALYGPDKLSINRISKELGSTRASFYHYFGDLRFFIEELLEMHWEIAVEYARKSAHVCKNLFPDMYLILEQYPVPLQFSRQLFFNRSHPAYNLLFIKTYKLSADAFALDLFLKHIHLDLNKEDAYNLWLLMGESWYSRIDIHKLTAQHMQETARDVLKSVLNLIRSELYSKINQ